MRLPALCLFLAACGESGTYDVVIEVPGRAERVEVSVLRSCDGVVRGEAPDEPLAQSEVRPFVPAEPLGKLAPGAYGLYGRAWDADCVLFAAACTGFQVDAGGQGTIRLELAATEERGCEAYQICEAGFCTGSEPDAGEPDAGGQENCSDGIDNDGDGAVDCEDPTCAVSIVCGPLGPGCDVADGECSTGNPLACEGCDWLCNDIAEPDFALTAFDLTAPAALDSPVMEGILSSAIDNGEFVWLIENADGRFRTGAGYCFFEDSFRVCEFDPVYNPAQGELFYVEETGELAIPQGASTIATEAGLVCGGETLDVTVVIRTESAGETPVALPLPLRQACLIGRVSHRGNCIGARINDVLPSDWDTDAGTVAGKITMRDASTIDIGEPVMATLCDLLAGWQPYGFCAENPDPSGWDDELTDPPDTTVDGDPAWTVTADFAAIGVLVID